MKFQITRLPSKLLTHSKALTGVNWSGNGDLYAASDEKFVFKWSSPTNDPETSPGEITKVLDTNDFFVTDFQLLNSQRGGIQQPDMFLLGCSDGTFRIFTASGRVEKIEKAHTGAITSVCFNPDSTSLLTAGEDGQVRQYSRAGHLRSKLASETSPIAQVRWNTTGDTVLYAYDRFLVLKSLRVNALPRRWMAHTAVLNCLDWSHVTGLIVSGAEDCRFKIWNSDAVLIYQSSLFEHAISSVVWNRDGSLLSIGSFGLLQLCSSDGTTLDRQLVEGSVVRQEWNVENMAVAFVSSGGLQIANLVNREINYLNFEFKQCDSKHVRVFDSENIIANAGGNQTPNEELEVMQKIADLKAGYGHFLVMTVRNLVIYNVKNFSMPTTIELKQGPASQILLSSSVFILLHRISGILCYTYDGKLISSSIKLPNCSPNQFSTLNPNKIALSDEILAFVDLKSPSLLHFIDVDQNASKNTFETFKHDLEITFVQVQQSAQGERCVAFIDRNQDAYLLQLQPLSTKLPCVKLASQAYSLRFHETNSLLIVLTAEQLITHYYPSMFFTDRDLVQYAKHAIETHLSGNTGQILNCVDSYISIKLNDGTQLSFALPYLNSVQLLQRLVIGNKWPVCSRLCRSLPDTTEANCCWAILVSLSLQHTNLDLCEIALAALDEIDKLQYVQLIKLIPSAEGRAAELQVYRHNINAAEQILLHADLIYRAIRLNINTYRWSRALELAIKYRQHIDTVLAFRIQYLQQTERPENDPVFQQYEAQYAHHLDWNVINQNIRQETEKEHRRGTQYRSQIPDLSADSFNKSKNQQHEPTNEEVHL